MEMPKWEKRYESLVNSLSGQSNTCRQNRREAVTQSQGTLLQTTRRPAKTAGEFEFGKKSAPGCNIVSLRILGCNLFYFRKFPVTQPERSWRAKKEQTGREPFEIKKIFMDGAEDDTTEKQKEE